MKYRVVDLAVTPNGRPGDATGFGKPGSKRELTDYERMIVHAILRKKKMPLSRAIAIARGQLNNAAHGKWGRKGHAHAPTMAGAQKSIAERASY